MASYFPQCWATLQLVVEGDEELQGPLFGPRTVQSIPVLRATVISNGIKEADKFTLEFDLKELPVHPDVIRACAVEIYMFDAGRPDVRDDLAAFATPENLQIAGLADVTTLRVSEDGRMVSFEGQDYTALIAGKVWPPGSRIPVGGQIDDVVQELIDEASGAAVHGRHLVVDYRARDDTTTTRAGAAITHKVVKAKKKAGAGGSKTHKRGIPAQADSTYWDVIYRLVLSHGLIVYVEGDKVVITEPRSLTEETAAEAVRLIYGHNLKSLEVERRIGNQVTPQIIATSAGNPPTEARWPPNDQLGRQAVNAKGKITGLGTSKAEALRVTAPARIRDEDELRDYARAYYEVQARSESTTRCETEHLRDPDARSLLAVRAGVPLRVSFDAIEGQGLERMSSTQRFEALQRAGYRPALADLLADNYDRIREAFSTILYCRVAEKSFDADSGIALKFEGIHYVDVERDRVE